MERAVGKLMSRGFRPRWFRRFLVLANEVPGFYFRLGQVKPGTTSGDHHTPTFLADDSSLPVGVKTMSYILFDYLSRK